MSVAQCRTCRFWDEPADGFDRKDEDQDYWPRVENRCLRRAPFVRSDGETRWPVTKDIDGCGEHERIVRPTDPRWNPALPTEDVGGLQMKGLSFGWPWKRKAKA